MTLAKAPRLDRIFHKYDPSLFFVTLCTRNRRKILANAMVHQTLIGYDDQGVARAIALGRYIIMPDHIHLFVAGRHNFESAWPAEEVCRRDGRRLQLQRASFNEQRSNRDVW